MGPIDQVGQTRVNKVTKGGCIFPKQKPQERACLHPNSQTKDT